MGRSEEVAALRRAVDAQSDTTVVLVEGAAGMGKTRLLSEALAGVEVSSRLRASGEEEQRLRPLGLLAKLLGQQPTGDALDALLDRLESMAAASGRGVVVVDDLQWCDDRSAAVLSSVLHRAAELPATIVLAARREPRSRAVAELAAAAHRDGSVLRLGRLTPEAVDELAARISEAPAEAVDAAQGHPFLLAQLASIRTTGTTLVSLTDAVPLSDVARRTLAFASVAGESVTVRELSLLAGTSLAEVMRAVGEAIDLGMLLDNDRRLAFTHDLWREAFSSEVPEPARRDLHREIASIRLAVGAEPLDVVSHLVAAAEGRDDELAQWLRDAARAAARHDLSAAIELGEQALAVASPSLATLIEADILSHLAWSGEADLGAARARALLLVVDDVRVRCRVHTALAIALSTAARNADAAAEARAALDTGRCTPRQEANLLVVEALGAWGTDVEGTLEAAVRAERVARDLGVPTAVASALVARLRALDGLRRFEEMRQPAREAQSIADELLATGEAPAGWALWIASGAADAETLNENDDEAYLRYGAIVQAAHRAHAPASLADALVSMFALDNRAGRWDDAQANLEAWDLLRLDAPGAAEGMGLTRIRRVVMEAWLQLAMEDRGVEDTIRRWRAEVRDNLEIAGHLVAQAEWQAQTGDLAGAANSYESAIERTWAERSVAGAGVPRTVSDQVGLAEIAVVAAAAGRDALLARAVFEAQQTLASNPSLPTVVAASHIAVAAAAPRRRADTQTILGATQCVRARVTRLRLLRATRLLCETTHADTPPEERASVDRAVAWLRRDLGISSTPPPDTASPWATLTPAECRVVDLVAQGLSNGEVARQLYLSRYTVESHLKRVFKKLGIRNRAALASAVARRHDPSRSV